VLIKVKGFIFSVDFVVLDAKRVSNLEFHIHVILERPCLVTYNALINYRNVIMKPSFDNMTLDLNIFNLQRHHDVLMMWIILPLTG